MKERVYTVIPRAIQDLITKLQVADMADTYIKVWSRKCQVTH